MAAERTWLAWWRTALAATVGAPRRLAPELLDVAAWPYVLLGCGYASLAIGAVIVGAQRQPSWSMRCERAYTDRCGSAPSGCLPSAGWRWP